MALVKGKSSISRQFEFRRKQSTLATYGALMEAGDLGPWQHSPFPSEYVPASHPP